MIFRRIKLKRLIALIILGLCITKFFALTPHINKGELEEISLSQAMNELGLSEQEIKDINKEFYGVLEFNSYFPAVQEADYDSPVQIFKQTFQETNEILYRVMSYTEEPEPFAKGGIFQKGYYSNGQSKPNLIFAEFYEVYATVFGQRITSVRVNNNFMPIIKENKIAGIMIYGIERYNEKKSIVEDEGSSEIFNHKAAVYWREDFSTADLRNTYSNRADIYINCSNPLIDEKDTFKYTIQNAFDKNPATSYVEDTEDDLFDINFIFAKEFFLRNYSVKSGEAENIIGILIINGYAENNNLYLFNNRIKELTISAYNLENKNNTSAFLNQINEKYNGLLNDNNLNYTQIQIPKEKINSIKFSCTQLYKGTKYNNTCLSEFDICVLQENNLFGE
jgi:hypothetical protein